MTLPQDPFILLSYINTQLRDNYSSLQALCEDLNINQESLETKLHEIGYDYIESCNQFR